MIISITVPDAITPRFRKVVNSTFPELDPSNTLTAKQLAEAATAKYWRELFIQFEQSNAEQTVRARLEAEIQAARNAAVVDAEGIA